MAQAGGEGTREHVMSPPLGQILAMSLQDLSNRSSVWDPQRRDSPWRFHASASLSLARSGRMVPFEFMGASLCSFAF